MSKVMLVEDDNNLREIYEARLLAEGYEIVSARDGEEALALAVKEQPDLIIADVMMPKISGFDMLDILRSTPETKDTKVIMMTALSQAEDKARATKLGADRYLVKSQVTLEDVARVAREVLDGVPESPLNDGAAAAIPDPTATASDPAAASPQPVADDNSTVAADDATATTAAEPEAQEKSDVAKEVQDFAQQTSDMTPPAEPASTGNAMHTKTIQPLNDLSRPSADLNELLAKEEQKEAMADASKPIISQATSTPQAPAPDQTTGTTSGPTS